MVDQECETVSCAHQVHTIFVPESPNVHSGYANVLLPQESSNDRDKRVGLVGIFSYLGIDRNMTEPYVSLTCTHIWFMPLIVWRL